MYFARLGCDCVDVDADGDVPDLWQRLRRRRQHRSTRERRSSATGSTTTAMIRLGQALPAGEIDDDGDSFAECEGDCDDLEQ